MVTKNVLRMTSIFRNIFQTREYCRSKQLPCPNLIADFTQICVPIFELPSNIATMIIFGRKYQLKTELNLPTTFILIFEIGQRKNRLEVETLKITRKKYLFEVSRLIYDKWGFFTKVFHKIFLVL